MVDLAGGAQGGRGRHAAQLGARLPLSAARADGLSSSGRATAREPRTAIGPFAVGMTGRYCLAAGGIAKAAAGVSDDRPAQQGCHSNPPPMIPRLAQGAAQYRNRLADRVRAGEGVAVAAGTAVVIVALALAEGGFSAGAAAGFGAGCWWLIFALVALRLAPADRIPRWALLAGGALFAFAAFTFLSRAWAADDGGAYRAAVLAFLYAGVFALVVLASRRGSIGGWLRGLALGLGAVCVLALATRWFPGFHHDDVTASLPDAKGRLSYPLGLLECPGLGTRAPRRPAGLARRLCALRARPGGGRRARSCCPPSASS